MGNRLDTERQERLERQRMKECKEKLESLGFTVGEYGGNRLEFYYNGEKIQHYPYSGWHSGKGIKAGRGFKKLLKQLK